MHRKSTVLTEEERDVLILGALHLDSGQRSNAEIGQHLGISENKVKGLIHQACVKLRAHNRNEAIHFTVKRGEIRINELYSLDEITQMFSSLDPYVLKRIAHLVRQGLGFNHLIEEIESIIPTDRRKRTILTKAERDVLVLAGCGLSNKEIADKLYISNNTVRSFFYRACSKLGTHRRADAVVLAAKRGEISVADIFSPNELIKVIVVLGDEYIEKIAQKLNEKLGQELVPTHS